MRKILFLFTLFFISNTFGQIDSQADKDALKELYKKLGRYQEGYFDRPLNLIYGITTKEFEGVNRVTRIDLTSNVTITNESDTSFLSGKIDLTTHLKQLEKLEYINLSPEPYLIYSEETYNYFINFEELINLNKLNTFIFKTLDSYNKFKLLTEKVNSLNKIINLNHLDLHELQLDRNENPYIFNEIASLKYIEDLSIKPYNRKGINSIYFENTENLKGLTFQSFEGNLPSDLFINIPNLKSFSAIDGNFTFLPSININTLEELKLGSLNLNITSNNFQNLRQLKTLELNTLSLNNLTNISKLINLENLKLVFQRADNTSLDLENLVKLKSLSYLHEIYHNHFDDYVYPKNFEKLKNLESLDISINESSINIDSLEKLKNLNFYYLSDNTLPKVNFSNSTLLEKLTFNRSAGAAMPNTLNNANAKRIKFDTDFEKLTNLNYISFYYIPIELNLTNKFNKLFNSTTFPKFLGFEDYNLSVTNKLDGVLNFCKNNNIEISIKGSSPEIIDLRLLSLNKKNNFFLRTVNNFSPLIIVDDIEAFKKIFGEKFRTFNNPISSTEIPYNLTTSTEPCVRTLSTNNLTKSDVKIYPNPVVDILNIESDVNKNSIKLFDITGKILESHTINDKKLSIIVNHLSKGIYIIEIENEKGKTISKFIKK